MLAVILCWTVILIASFGYGRLLFPDKRGLEGLRLYAGLLISCATLLALANVVRVSTWLGLAVEAVGIALAINRRVPWALLARRAGLVLLALIPLAALGASTEVTYYDTGLYHHQAVKWLAEHGVVTGLALVDVRYAWASSWYALAAALNHGVLAGRVSGIVGGIPLITMGAFVLFSEDRLRLRWAVLCCFLAGVMLWWRMEASLSPDPIVWLAPAVIVQILEDPELRFRGGRALVIAALAFSVKSLGGAPLVFYCGCVAVWELIKGRDDRKTTLALGLAAMAIIVSVFLVNVRLSGCPAFPTTAGCVATKWTVESGRAAAMLANFAQVSQPHTERLPAVFLTAVMSLWLVATRRPRPWHVLGISWVGIATIGMTTFTTRYAMGFLLLPVATAVASVLPVMTRPLRVRIAPASVVAACSVVAAALFSAAWLPRRIAREGEAFRLKKRGEDRRLTLQLRAVRLGDLTVFEGTRSDQCWDAPTPCSSYPGASSIVPVESAGRTKFIRGD